MDFSAKCLRSNNIRWLALATLTLLVAATSPLAAQQTVPQPAGVRDLQSDTWVGTDALGRTLPAAGTAPPRRKDRYVGVFYFLWHGQHGTGGPYDITQTIADPAGHPFGPPGAFHWWGEPAVGYFLATDPWVHRRNVAMLADAGVDVLICDATNAFTYPQVTETLCRVMEQMRREGNPTPQIAFITHARPADTVTRLYNDFYAKGLHKDLWFQWDGKPLILGDKAGKMDNGSPMDPKIAEFFTWRNSWAWDPGQDKWQWIDKYPQRPGWHDDPTKPEEVPVSIAGHPVDSLGRSYHSLAQWGKGTEPPVDAHQLVPERAKGLQFTQQWQRALTLDPRFVFVTGWNEWVAQRFLRSDAGPSQLAGRPIGKGDSMFIDEYNEEFSRDAMPMKGGFGDDYYMQLADNIRRFKGVRSLPTVQGFRTLPPGSSLRGWNQVTPEYRDAAGDVGHRDWNGWGKLHYTDASGRNDIVSAKVAADARNVYFYVRTRQPLSPHTDPDWMQLLIDSDRNPRTGWHGYDFVVNSRVLSSSETTLKRMRDGKTWTLPYRAAGNVLTIAIPRRLLGLAHPAETTLDFHWADHAPVGTGDLTDWWYHGDSAPDGRFNYRVRVVSPKVTRR